MGDLAFFPLAVVLFPTGVGERSSGQSHVTPVFTTQAETLATAHVFVFLAAPHPQRKTFHNAYRIFSNPKNYSLPFKPKCTVNPLFQ